jgi:hypothetical protein
MNKSLASFVFSGETLFCLPNEPVTSSDEAKVAINASSVVELPSKYKPVRKFLILTTKLTPSNKQLFEKIMESVNISLDDVDLIEIEHLDQYDFSPPLIGNFIFSFGDLLSLIGIPLRLTPYQSLTIKGKKILLFDNFNVISDNLNGEKKKLWVALKELVL